MSKVLVKSSEFFYALVSFFVFYGFYSGLGVVIFIAGRDYSRYYSVPVRSLVALVMVVCITLLLSRKRFRASAVHYLVVFMFLSFWIIYLFNIVANFSGESYRIPAYEYFFYSVAFCVVPFLFFLVSGYENYKKAVVSGILWGGGIGAAVTVALYGDVLLYGGFNRLSSVESLDPDFQSLSPITLSYMAAVTISVSMLMLNEGKEGRKRFVALIIVSLPALILGASRGALLSLMFSFFVIMLVNRRGGRLKVASAAIVLSCILLFMTELTGSGLIDRFLNIKSDIDQGSQSAVRIEMWRAAIESFYLSPWVGGQMEIDGRYPHNFVFEILMNVGVVGAFLFFVPFFWCFFKAINMAISVRDGFPLLILVLGTVYHLFSGSINNAIIISSAMGMIVSGDIFLSRGGRSLCLGKNSL